MQHEMDNRTNFAMESLQAVVALAGFFVGEVYCVPWSEVPVPEGLQLQVFPFVEGVLSKLEMCNGKLNQGTEFSGAPPC